SAELNQGNSVSAISRKSLWPRRWTPRISAASWAFHRLYPSLAFRARRLLAHFAARGIPLKGSNQSCPGGLHRQARPALGGAAAWPVAAFPESYIVYRV